jgi:hypothetical protein
MPFARTRGTRGALPTSDPAIAAGEGHDDPPKNNAYASWYSANSHGCGRIRIASTSSSRL